MSDEAPRSEGLALLAELERTGALTMTSLTLPPGLPYSQYEALFGLFGQVHELSAWVIGDLLNYGEKVYGETYAQAAHMTGLAEQTLMNYTSVCGRIPKSRRLNSITFSVHAEVAYLSPADQEKWLKLARANGWRRSQMREALAPVRAQLGRARPRPELGMPHHVETTQPRVEGEPIIVESPNGRVEILPPAVVAGLPQHICQCMVCGRLHRSDSDIEVPA